MLLLFHIFVVVIIDHVYWTIVFGFDHDYYLYMYKVYGAVFIDDNTICFIYFVKKAHGITVPLREA